MSWKVFEEDSPELASLGFRRVNRRLVFLAILNKDGSPRLHPVTPFIGNGMLFMFTEPSSPKIRKLRRDGRYALHSSVVGEDPLFEFLVSGKAKEITDPVVRGRAEVIANSPVVTDTYALFEFQIERVLVIEYDENKKRTVHRWRADKTK